MNAVTPAGSGRSAPAGHHHAVVTGGGQGIGAAVARSLVAKGMRVTVLGRRLDVVRALAEQDLVRMHAVAADVSDPEQVRGAVVAVAVPVGDDGGSPRRE